MMKVKSLVYIKNRRANGVDPYESARYESYNLDLHCLQKYLFRSTGLNRLMFSTTVFICSPRK